MASAQILRRRLFESSVAVVEDVRHHGGDGLGALDFCGVYQVCLPYDGLFVWRVADDEVVGDPTQAIFVRAGEPYRMCAPVAGGFAELILTVDAGLLADLTGATRVADHPLFTRRSYLAPARLQALRTQFLHWATTAPAIDPLQADEAVLRLLRAAVRGDGRTCRAASRSTQRIIRRAKQYMQAHLAEPIRLADIGRAAGASPTYLTDAFRQIEGVSLHRYLTRLRLGRALVQLPHATDLTAVALDAGFSSHSHFTAVFKSAFGSTPSAFRRSSGRAQPRLEGEAW